MSDFLRARGKASRCRAVCCLDLGGLLGETDLWDSGAGLLGLREGSASSGKLLQRFERGAGSTCDPTPMSVMRRG